MKRKTYSRRIFGGKDAVWTGIDQGTGECEPHTVSMALNATFSDNVMKSRLGQTLDGLTVTGVIRSAINTQKSVAVCAGTDIFLEEI